MTIVGIQQLFDLRGIEPARAVGRIGRQQLAQCLDQAIAFIFRHDDALEWMSLPLRIHVADASHRLDTVRTAREVQQLLW